MTLDAPSIRSVPGRRAGPLLVLLLGAALGAAGARAVHSEERTTTAMLERLDERQRHEFQLWRTARERYEAELAAYWGVVEQKRVLRRQKLGAGQPFEADDYVTVFPPEYAGPALSPEIARIWEQTRPKEEPQPIPTVADVLESAKTVYGFEPERISEREFKRRYALEALAKGLTKDQIVRVYALETGGQGTHDMQSGINPVTRRGQPISTALGYAQLLHANSVNELVKHGGTFIARLESTAGAPGLKPQRAAALRQKARVLRRMLANARSVPNEWRDHMRFAATPQGLGIHALNLDGDIGPLLQVIKLRGVREVAEKAGRTALTPAELELMNLAGPRTGLEMMTPLGRTAPTTNFFSRGGYQRNPIVHKRSGAELLAELDARMDVHMTKPGAVEFAVVFDEVMSPGEKR